MFVGLLGVIFGSIDLILKFLTLKNTDSDTIQE